MGERLTIVRKLGDYFTLEVTCLDPNYAQLNPLGVYANVDLGTNSVTSLAVGEDVAYLRVTDPETGEVAINAPSACQNLLHPLLQLPAEIKPPLMRLVNVVGTAYFARWEYDGDVVVNGDIEPDALLRASGSVIVQGEIGREAEIESVGPGCRMVYAPQVARGVRVSFLEDENTSECEETGVTRCERGMLLCHQGAGSGITPGFSVTPVNNSNGGHIVTGGGAINIEIAPAELLERRSQLTSTAGVAERKSEGSKHEHTYRLESKSKATTRRIIDRHRIVLEEEKDPLRIIGNWADRALNKVRQQGWIK